MEDISISKANKKRAENPKSVLFLCNHNVIRSVIGEHLLKLMSNNQIYCDSAGVTIGQPDPFVQAVMKEINVDIQEHKPKMLEELEQGWFDLIVTHSPQAHHVALDMEWIKTANIVYWPAADPTVVQGAREQRLEAYRDVRQSIAEKITEYFKFSVHK